MKFSLKKLCITILAFILMGAITMLIANKENREVFVPAGETEQIDVFQIKI